MRVLGGDCVAVGACCFFCEPGDEGGSVGDFRRLPLLLSFRFRGREWFLLWCLLGEGLVC